MIDTVKCEPGQTCMDKLIEIIARETGTDPALLSPSTELDFLDMDSLDRVSLIQCIANEIGEVDASANCLTITDLAGCVTEARCR